MFQCYAHSLGWLPALVFAGNLILIVYLSRYGTRSSSVIWFQTLLINGLAYAASTAFMYCSQTNSSFVFWLDIFNFTTCLSPVTVTIFTLHFINKSHLLNVVWVRAALILVPSTLLFLFWTTDLITIRDLARANLEWGYHSPALGPLSGLLSIVLMVGYILPISMMAYYHRHLEEPIKKKEVRLVLIAFVVGILPAVVVSGIIPTLFHVPSVPLSPFFGFVMSATITYAITHYGMHTFSLNNMSGNIIQIMPGGLIVLDHTNTIQYTNAGAAAMLGYETGQLSGTSLKKLFPGAVPYGEFQKGVLSRLTPDQSVTGQEAEFTTRRRTPLSVSLNATSVYYGRELVNRIISFTDITKLKATEAELEAEKAGVERKVVQRTHELAAAQAKLSASINSLPLGYVMVDDKGEVAALNPSARTILHLTDRTQPSIELLNKKLGDYDLARLLKDCLSHRRSSEVKELAVGAQYLHIYASPIFGERNAVIGAVLLVEDITEQKILDRSKDEFFSIASHELRTPLTSIRGNSSMMINYYQEALHNPELQEMVHDVHESSIRLIGIVNDFLDVSRLEQGKMTFKLTEADMFPLIDGVTTELKTELAAKKTKLILDPTLKGLPHVVADPDRFKQIIFNLVGNALKFTEKGTITLSSKVEGEAITVFVTDTGRGMPPAAQNLLFHKFQQGGASLLTRDTVKGTGLGLYISRLIVEGMDGRIWLEQSEEGKGTTFAFSLPIATPHRLADLAKALLEAQAATNITTGITTAIPASTDAKQ